MDSGEMVERPQQALREKMLGLEAGDWPAVLTPDPSRPAGPSVLVRGYAALRCVARSMELQFLGDVQGASDELEKAVRLLANSYVNPADPTRVALPPRPPAAAPDMTIWRLARLVWREQTEIAHLRALCAPDRLRPRELLAVAYIEHLMWVELDPFAPVWCRPPARYPDQSRLSLCGRASELRRLTDPRAGDLSQSVWRDIGALAGLRSLALDRLAERPHPAPWCGGPGVDELPVRRGRVRAWEHAQRCREDCDYWRSSPPDG